MQSQIGIGELWASPYTIRTSGTYKFAAQATTLVFEAYGAFGGGQDGAVSLGGNGASGPPYIKKTLTGLVIGTTYNVVVGSAGANGVDGGDCYWDDGSLAKCKGGKTDGTQTTGNVGDVINLGGLGGSAGSTGGGGGSTGAGGNGAAGGVGTGGAGGTAGTVGGTAGGTGGAAANPGVAPGGGGGTLHVGGAGQAGQVVLTWPAPSTDNPELYCRVMMAQP